MRGDARQLAVQFLDEVFSRPRHADSLSRDRRFLALEARERRLCMELVNGVLRNLPLLDFHIRSLSSRPFQKLDRMVLWVLRVALYQLVFLRIPARATVHESVRLCPVFRKSSAKGFVNALLRAFLRRPPDLPQGDDAAALGIRHGHPEWLVKRYLARYGLTGAIRLMERNNRTPRPPLWVNPFRAELEDFQGKLSAAGIPFQAHPRLPNCLRVPSAFARHPLYGRGHCFFMDEGSQGIALRADLGQARMVGDFCAAPGGKAFLLAASLPLGATLFCCDAHWRRLLEFSSRARRFRVPVQVTAADLSQGTPFRPVFDFVLLDVPCSGLGTIAANPDIRWKVQESDLPVLARRQSAILDHGFRALKPDGRLLYSTCSTEPEENEKVVELFLDRHPAAFRLDEDRRNFPAGRGQAFFSALIGQAV